MIIHNSDIELITDNVVVAYEKKNDDWEFDVADESVRRVNEWMIHHMDEAPFHKLCYNSSIATKTINDYLIENGDDAALHIDTIHDMTPLYMLTMNPHAPVDAIAALLNVDMQSLFYVDNQRNTPLENAREYNVAGLVGMIDGLCNHRKPSIPVYKVSDTDHENGSK